jgi:hypothetical protein
MSNLKTPIKFETAFGEYTLHEQIGEGGAGRVFGGVDAAPYTRMIRALSAAVRMPRVDAIGDLRR